MSNILCFCAPFCCAWNCSLQSHVNGYLGEVHSQVLPSSKMNAEAENLCSGESHAINAIKWIGMERMLFSRM